MTYCLAKRGRIMQLSSLLSTASVSSLVGLLVCLPVSAETLTAADTVPLAINYQAPVADPVLRRREAG